MLPGTPGVLCFTGESFVVAPLNSLENGTVPISVLPLTKMEWGRGFRRLLRQDLGAAILQKDQGHLLVPDYLPHPSQKVWPTIRIGDLSFNVNFLWHVRREYSAKFTQLSMQPIDHVWPVLAIIRVHSHVRNSIQSSTAQSLCVNPYQLSALGIVARLLDIDTDFSLCQVLRDDHAGDSMIDIANDVTNSNRHLSPNLSDLPVRGRRGGRCRLRG